MLKFGSYALIDARTSSGDVRLRAVANALVRTSSGDVSAEGLVALDVSTASGDVNVSGASGALRLETASGDIVVADAPAGVSAHTASGEVVLHAACARVDVGTQSGDIRVRLRSPLERAQAASVSGSVSLDMVQGTGAELSARSTSGSIDCEMPSVVRQHSDRSLDARLGKGGAPVRLETVSGDVTITSGGK